MHQKLQMKKCTSGDVNCCFPETLAGWQEQLQKHKWHEQTLSMMGPIFPLRSWPCLQCARNWHRKRCKLVDSPRARLSPCRSHFCLILMDSISNFNRKRFWPRADCSTPHALARITVFLVEARGWNYRGVQQMRAKRGNLSCQFAILATIHSGHVASLECQRCCPGSISFSASWTILSRCSSVSFSCRRFMKSHYIYI